MTGVSINLSQFIPQKENKELSRAISVLVRERQYEKARIELEKYIEMHPRTVWARHQLSLIYYQLGRVDLAIEYLEKLIEMDPENADYALALGSLSYDNTSNQDFEKAIKYLEKALEKKPNDHHAWRNYGVTLYQNGRVEEGFNALFKSCMLNPDDFVTNNSLCMYLEQKGRNMEARAHGAMAMLSKHKKAMDTFNLWKDRLDLSLQPKPVYKHGQINVMSFSLWGDNPTYTHGAVENVEKMGKFFPGWICRFYHDETVPQHIIRKLHALKAQTILVDKELSALAGGNWRFSVANDPDVYYFCCRDADCRPSEREAASVNEWLASGKSFHVMRDDIWHCEVMLAGLWGGTAMMLPDMLKMGKATYDNSVRRWDDQEFLRDYIWPLIHTDAMIHDNNYRQLGAKPHPIPRPVGKEHIGFGHRLAKPITEVKSFTLNEGKSLNERIEEIVREQLDKNPNTQEIFLDIGPNRRVRVARNGDSNTFTMSEEVV